MQGHVVKDKMEFLNQLSKREENLSFQAKEKNIDYDQLKVAKPSVAEETPSAAVGSQGYKGSLNYAEYQKLSQKTENVAAEKAGPKKKGFLKRLFGRA